MAQDYSDYRILPANRSWVAAPGAFTVMQRKVGWDVEQLVALSNTTSIPGDNQMILRASGRGGQSAGRLRLEALRSRIGGFPAPFARLKPTEMQSVDDDLGSYSYGAAEYGNITCVLAVRRVDASNRPIPARGSAIDAMLRNCVVGSADDALVPIQAAAFGHAGFAASGSIHRSRLLSPLSAPLPD